MLAKSHGFRISVGGDVRDRQETHVVPALTSSVQTVKPASVGGPNVLLIATSVASRPRAMSTRPIRGMLFRGSNVCQCPPLEASTQPAKSIAPYRGGQPTPPGYPRHSPAA